LPNAAFILVGRFVFGAIFLLAFVLTLSDMSGTALYIASAGFPAPLLLAWVAAIFELVLALAFFTGAYFSPASLVASVYILFLGIVFHGPGRWSNQLEFGLFLNHFSFFAGLLFAAVHGPGTTLVLRGPLPFDGDSKAETSSL
jgi:putative oxidoreductase